MYQFAMEIGEPNHNLGHPKATNNQACHHKAMEPLNVGTMEHSIMINDTRNDK